ncbi:hypothetical protein GETHLI_14610 [Geothrix limicola]|uniref:SnoaL-like domain-containing protein n=1 Tax=Geothrix limicola TaxID=2927978 RepID=A0ABQ5QFZ2_9BACT|nr:nuclear transport factor 2 family protein [Geothrix limicola]GLH72959.1 hypothetical protein GETHLI_14610 [Geothrix limicola]
MKILRTLAQAGLLAVALAAPAQPQETLSEAQQAQIRAEVLQAVKPLLAAVERLDIQAMRTLSHKSPEFSFVMPDGTSYGFEEVLATAKELFANLSGQKMITQKERVLVLAPDAALYLWQGRNDVMQKDGVLLRSDPYCCTYLYRKVDGQWKFAYGHESGLPSQPVRVEESEKGR